MQGVRTYCFPSFLPAHKYDEVEVKLALDGYSFQRFIKELEPHFQAGYAITRIGSLVATEPNSRCSFRAIATAKAKEEECIGVLGRFLTSQLGALHTFDASVREGACVMELPPFDPPRERKPRLRALRIVMAMDTKALWLILGRATGHSKFFCPFGCSDGCTIFNSKTTVRAIPATTTYGELRALARVAGMGYDAWKNMEMQAGRGNLGTGYNGKLLKSDYELAMKGQLNHPALGPELVPDDVKVILLHVIAPLHTKIQTVNHFTEFFVELASNWTTGKGHIRVGGRPVDKGKLPLSGNAFFTTKSFFRPVLGYTGAKLNLMSTSSDEWLDELLTSDTATCRFGADEMVSFPAHAHPSAIGGKVHHPKLLAAKGVMTMLNILLETINNVNPSAEDVGAFRERAIAWGEYVLEHFPEYQLKPYEHFLCCHMWEQMEHFGGVGRLSEIVCEASNAVFKNQHQRHEKHGSTRRSESALVNVTASTNPEHVYKDLL